MKPVLICMIPLYLEIKKTNGTLRKNDAASINSMKKRDYAAFAYRIISKDKLDSNPLKTVQTGLMVKKQLSLKKIS
jgi:hypothetical protein